MFRRAGIRRKTAPAFMPGCKDAETNEDWDAPIIVSPIPDTKIVITAERDFEPIGFMAFGADADAKLFWFLDDKILGSTKSGETLQYNIPMGEHILRVTDPAGITTEMSFSMVK